MKHLLKPPASSVLDSTSTRVVFCVFLLTCYQQIELNADILLVWRQAFDALWKRFDTKFSYILNNIKQHKILLERQANLAEFEEARKGRDLAARNFESLEKEALLQRKAFLGRWLAAVDASEDLEKGQEARTSNPNSGRWLLKKSHFRSWLDLDRPSDSMLWIHGKPGSGILLSQHFERLEKG